MTEDATGLHPNVGNDGPRMHSEPRPHITAVASDPVSGMHRFTIPMRALIERGVATGNLSIGLEQTPQISPGSPLLVQGERSLAPTLVTRAKNNHCRLVYDVDQPWSLSSETGAMERRLGYADLITVSTNPLADVLRKRGYRPVVLPTTIDPRDWSLQPPRAERTRPRIGWPTLHSAHVDELALIEGVVQTLIAEADFVFVGNVPPAMSDAAGRIEHHLPVPLSFFPTVLAALDLDMVLAPLANNESSECRSNLQLLQAGMLGYPVLATDIEPHRTLPVKLLQNTPGEWIAAIRERIYDSEALRREGETLRHAVHANLLVASWTDRYLEQWTGTSSAVSHV